MQHCPFVAFKKSSSVATKAQLKVISFVLRITLPMVEVPDNKLDVIRVWASLQSRIKVTNGAKADSYFCTLTYQRPSGAKQIKDSFQT